MAGAGPFAAAGRRDVDASHRVLGDSESNLSGAVVDQNGILVCFGGMCLVVSSAFHDGFEIARLWFRKDVMDRNSYYKRFITAFKDAEKEPPKQARLRPWLQC